MRPAVAGAERMRYSPGWSRARTPRLRICARSHLDDVVHAARRLHRPPGPDRAPSHPMARGPRGHLPDLVPLGGAAQELPLHPSRARGGRRRDRGGHLRHRVQGVVARDGRRLDRRAAADVQGRRPRVALEAQAAHPGHLREPGEPARLRPLPPRVRLLRHRAGGARGRAPAREAGDQGARPHGGEPPLLPASHHRPAVPAHRPALVLPCLRGSMAPATDSPRPTRPPGGERPDQRVHRPGSLGR